MNALMNKITDQLKFNSDNIFIKDENRKLSFQEFNSFTFYISNQLKALNLQPNDLVLLDIKDPFYFAAYVFACFHLKLRPALLNSYSKKNQIDEILSKNIYSIFITDQSHPELKCHFIDTKAPFEFEDGILNIDPESEIIFYTSGSIEIKACVLTLSNFFYSAEGAAQNIPFKELNSWGLTLPLFHVGGFSIFVRAILCYGTIVVLDPSQNLSDQILRHNISHISLVSTQFIKYIEQYKLTSSLEYILLGGSAIPETALLKAIEFRMPIYKSYGMTEMASQICTTKKIVSPTDIPYSGYLLKYRELKISDKEIYVKGPCLFKGYLKNNILSTSVDAEGWFFTKDCGSVENSQIKIQGRSDRIFQSAGENISPELIEQELLKVPGVLRAYVCPEIDSKYGHRPVAYIEKREGLKDETILGQLETRLSGLYRPKALKPWAESPKISWKQ